MKLHLSRINLGLKYLRSFQLDRYLLKVTVTLTSFDYDLSKVKFIFDMKRNDLCTWLSSLKKELTDVGQISVIKL